MNTKKSEGHLVVRHKDTGITGVVMYPKHFFAHAGNAQKGMSVKWDEITKKISHRIFLGDIYVSEFEEECETDPFIKNVSWNDIEVIGLRVNGTLIKIGRLDRDTEQTSTCKDCSGKLVKVRNMGWYLRCRKCDRVHNNNGNPLVLTKGGQPVFAELQAQFYTKKNK